LRTQHANTMVNLLGNILCSSIKNLFDHQSDIFKFASETGETEWNLGHHLANEIHNYIFWLNCDLDLTKAQYSYKRPDIIFHKRGIHALNFLVVELKHRGASSEEDIKKISEDWMGSSLHYRFGASINILDSTQYKVTLLYENAKYEFIQVSPYIPLRDPLTAIEINALVAEAYAIKHAEPETDISALEHRIDKLVYELYAVTPDETAIVE